MNRRSGRRRWIAVLVGGLLAAGCTTTSGGLPSFSATSLSAASPPTPPSDPSPTASTVPTVPTVTVSAPVDCPVGPCYLPPRNTGEIVGTAAEASGIAASDTDPDLFFVVDDATGTSDVVAVRSDGTVVADVVVDGLDPDNAEALAHGVCTAGSSEKCLYVGDLGAGRAGRSDVRVFRFTEPAASAVVQGTATATADSWSYRYPDGAYNAESLLIGDDGAILVVTKPDAGVADHRLYRGAPGGGDLTLVSTFRPPEPAVPFQSSLVGTVATDTARLDDRVLLLTYDQAVEYLAPTPGADPAGFPTWPYRQWAIPKQWQSEGVTYRSPAEPPGCGFVVVSEQGLAGGAALGTVDCA